ncbi:MAG: hypothetical protein QQN46_04555 [Nitrosopumilus sp.]
MKLVRKYFLNIVILSFKNITRIFCYYITTQAYPLVLNEGVTIQ